VSASDVSFVVPVKNGAAWLPAVLDAIFAEADGVRARGGAVEVIAVDDGSTDGSAALLAGRDGVRLLTGPGRGGAAALNVGIRAARHPIVCQIDQDVVLRPGFVAAVLAELDADPEAAAVQGHFVADPTHSLWARVMGLDLAERYAAIRGVRVDHVCTGNSAYRTDALLRVGLFDERMGYGYDNDMSYRLVGAGHRLLLCRAARSVHHFRPDAVGYFSNQYGLGYGRLDLVVKHPRKIGGDAVSGPLMMLHAPVMALALLLLVGGAVAALAGGAAAARAALGAGAALVVVLALERLVASVRAFRRSRDRAAAFFVVAHLWRDVAWAAAIYVFCVRRLLWRPRRPSDSMG
jgi:GT2 family glycosyltransferase